MIHTSLIYRAIYNLRRTGVYVWGCEWLQLRDGCIRWGGDRGKGSGSFGGKWKFVV